MIQIDWNKSIEKGVHEMKAGYEPLLKHIEEAQKQSDQTVDDALGKVDGNDNGAI